VEWFLLPTVNITSPKVAEQCLRWYCLRWRIENWRRVFKSGCAIEDLTHKTADRLRRAVAINLVIAWRIMVMTLLSREMPNLPAEVLFSDIELRTLQAYAKKYE
jgi:biopolymer transport protein ExbB/TolQ